jgi:hypothetical protein
VHDVVEEYALALLAHPGIGRGHFVADLAALWNRLVILHRIVKLLLQLVETLLLGLEVHRVRLSPAAALLWSLNDWCVFLFLDDTDLDSHLNSVLNLATRLFLPLLLKYI